LDDATKTDFITQLDAWNKTCYDLADQKKSCLIMQNNLSVSGAVRVAMRSQFLQEVCGIYMNSIDKFFADGSTFQFNDEWQKTWAGYKSSIDIYIDSMLSDQAISRYKETNYNTRRASAQHTCNMYPAQSKHPCVTDTYTDQLLG
jgi:hypothetical protein